MGTTPKSELLPPFHLYEFLSFFCLSARKHEQNSPLYTLADALAHANIPLVLREDQDWERWERVALNSFLSPGSGTRQVLLGSTLGGPSYIASVPRTSMLLCVVLRYATTLNGRLGVSDCFGEKT